MPHSFTTTTPMATHASAPAAAQPPSAGSHTPLPYTPNCHRILQDADHLLIGVSPGNGYFSIPTLTRMFRWAHATFGRVDVIVPDRSLASNYRAQGYPEQAARKKARTEVSCVRRRVRRAWERGEIPEEHRRAHLLSDLARSDAYEQLHLRVRDALTTDGRIRALCRSLSARAVPVAAAASGTPGGPGTATGSAEDGGAEPGARAATPLPWPWSTSSTNCPSSSIHRASSASPRHWPATTRRLGSPICSTPRTVPCTPQRTRASSSSRTT